MTSRQVFVRQILMQRLYHLYERCYFWLVSEHPNEAAVICRHVRPGIEAIESDLRNRAPR